VEFNELTDRSTPAGRLVLLTVAAFVALAPLCSIVIAAPQGSSVAALHGDHAMSSTQHDAPVAILTAATIGGAHHSEHCTPHSCCAAALVKTARLKQADGTAVLAVATTTAIESQDSCRLARVAGPAATPAAAVAHAPLRL